MPKQRIDPAEIVETAYRILTTEGRDAVTAARIAREMGCSVQPIYSTFGGMDGLWEEVEQTAVEAVHARLAREWDPNNLFESTGRVMATIAREEPELFRVFATARRRNIASLEDLLNAEGNPETAEQLSRTLNIPVADARKLHMHMLIYTLGLGAICASCEPGLSPQEAGAQMYSAAEIFIKDTQRKKAQV